MTIVSLMFMQASNSKYHLELIAANLLYGANLVVYNILVQQHMHFAQLFILQVAFAAAVFIPLLIFNRRFALGFKDIMRLVINSALIVYGAMYFTVWGMSLTSATDGALIALLGPVFTVLLQRKIHQNIRINYYSAALIMAAIFFYAMEFTQGRWQGNLLVLLSVMCVSLNTVLIKPMLIQHGTIKIMAWCYSLGFVITAPVFLPSVIHFDFGVLNNSAWVDLAYILLIGTLVPSYMLYKGTEMLAPVQTALYRCLRPLAAIALTLYRGHQVLSWEIVTISVVVCLALFFIVLCYRKYLDTSRSKHSQKS